MARTIQLSSYVEKELDDRLQQAVQSSGLSKSRFIEEVLKEKLADYPKVIVTEEKKD